MNDAAWQTPLLFAVLFVAALLLARWERRHP